MGKIIERCAGIDIGKRFLLCCVLTGAAHEEPSSETRRFDTTVPGLERLRNWLNDERVTDVVMESTGSYWIPVFNLLEGRVTIVLANPEEVKIGRAIRLIVKMRSTSRIYYGTTTSGPVTFRQSRCANSVILIGVEFS